MLALRTIFQSFSCQLPFSAFVLRTIRNGCIALALAFPLLAHALTITIPSTDADGSYPVTWSGVRTYVVLYEQINGQWSSIANSNLASYTFSVTGKVAGTYNYKFSDCLVTGSQGGSSTSCLDSFKTVLVSLDQPTTTIANKEISTNNYDVYIGDLNSDGKSDYYFNGKQQIILLHGDIITPVVILPPPSFMVVKDGAGYSNPQLFKITPEQLSAKITANTLRKSQVNSDYYVWSDGVSGQSKVLLRGSSATEPSLLLLSTATAQTPSIGQVFQPNANANLSNYSLSIGFNDFNSDGRKDLDINGYTYLSNTSGSIDATPVIKFSPPASVTVGLDFMTGVPWVTWPLVANAMQYEVREMLGGYPTGVLRTVTSNNATFSQLIQLGNYTYEVRACALLSGAPYCSNWIASNGVKSNLTVAPTINAPIFNTNGIYNVSWSRVVGATRYELYENGVLIQNTSDLVKFFSGSNTKVTGTYVYQVRACGQQCGPASTILTTTVNRGSNNVPVTSVSTQIQKSTELTGGNVDSQPITDVPTGAPVGTLAGQFRVNESGAATYSVAIAVVDGVAGVTPHINIGYSSQSGNGLLGKGWGLNGLSAITRCRQTLSQDGAAKPLTWTAEDRFCLDGQRLMLVSGTYGTAGSTYKTEIDTFVTVTAVGGSNGNPDYFTVEAKDGSVTSYGESGADGSEVSTTSGVFTWNIKRFKDNVGNPIVYVYEGGLVDNHIKEIRYAYGVSKVDSAYGARILFEYKVRDDQSRGYVAGFEVKNTKRLDKITTYNGDTNPVRIYNIGYDYAPARIGGYSRVISVQECSSQNCYPATTFSWYAPTAPETYGKQLGSIALNSGKVVVTNQAYLDINGNGILDYVWSEGNGDIKYSVDAAAVETGNVVSLYHTLDSFQIPQLEPIDYNGDGHQDLLVYLPKKKKWYLYLSVRTSVGWELKDQSIDLPFSSAQITVGDIDSDGIADVFATETGIVYAPPIVCLLKKRGGVPVESNLAYGFTCGTSEYFKETSSSLVYTFLLTSTKKAARGDFNGDGRMDFAALTYVPTSNGWDYRYQVYVADENNQFKQYARVTEGNTNSDRYDVSAADINGDGLTDVAYLANNIWYYKLNTGSGFTAATPLYESTDKKSKKQEFSFTDINHDGFADVVWRDSEYVETDPGVYNEESATYEGAVGSEVLTIYVKYWSPSTASFSSTSVLHGNADLDFDYSYMDVNGDSWVDEIATGIYGKKPTTTMNIKGFSAGSNYTAEGVVASDQITVITDGLDNKTTINYAPLSRTDHYAPIGGIKIVDHVVTQCHPDITVNAGLGGTINIPAGCVDVTTYDINTDPYYKLINDPFSDFIGIGDGKINADDLTDVPVLEVTGPVTIVTSVESAAPVASESEPDNITIQQNKVQYSYQHMRMQAAGRGILGFEYLSTVDMQTGVVTKTRYRQDWPYIGFPAETTIKRGEKVLSKATNSWARRAEPVPNSIGVRYQPYLQKSVEQTYRLDSDGTVSATPSQTVTTDTVMTPDDYGNVDLLTVTTEGGGDTLVKITDNKFDGSVWEKQMGRLTSSKVTTTRNGQLDTNRTVDFTYYPQASAQKGLLWTEIVEKDTPETKLTTEYIYDSWGNKTEVKVKGFAEVGGSEDEIRTTKNAYDSNGRYLTSTTNDENQSSTINERDPATGQPTNVSDINHVAAQVYYDSMGKEYLRADGTGAWSRTDTKLCTTTCPTGAKFYTLTRVAGGGQSTSYFDSLGRTIRSSKVGFDGKNINVDTEYDRLGRTLRQSTPFFDDDSPVGWTTNEYDILGRVTKVTLPNSSFSTSTYTGNTTTITNDLGYTRTEQHNGLGQLVQVTDNLSGTIAYTYNTNGALLTATTQAPDHLTPIAVRMCYDSLGRKTGMLDPDKGGWLANNTDCSALSGDAPGWWKYSYNAFGELASQRDAKGQITTMKYDKLGRMIKRTDEEQTRWFYDKTIAGVSSAGSAGKLMAVVVRKDASEIASCLGTDNCTQYFYDQYARPTETLVLYPNDTTGYVASVKYDSIGRAYETRDALNGAVFNDSGVQTQYNQYGYAYRTIDIAPLGGGKGILSEIISTNVRGQVTEEWRNNSNFVTKNTYDDLTGLLLTQKATTALANMLGTTQIQNETYTWDTLGNLKTRENKNANVGSTSNKNLAETFYYDGLNRLIKSTGSGRGNQTADCSSQDISYDGLGNITCKNGVGNYAYGNNAGPHAVTSTTLGSATTTYQYDANGNMVHDTDRTLSYTAYDMVKTISKGGDSTSFSYGADHARWQRVDVKGGVTTTTTYLGNVERVQKFGSNEVEWRRSVGGAIFTFKTNANNQLLASGTNTAYAFYDHLGSVDAITNAAGKVTHSMSFDPWGARRDGENWGALSEGQRIAALKIGDGNVFREPITQRGFTGHEMVDDMGIIHMNGRIYDAKLGRFLQADPHVDGAGNTQGYNRYSYMHNNPLNGTDPSGFSSLRQFVGFIVAVVGFRICGAACAKPGLAMMALGATAAAAQVAANGGNRYDILFGALSGAFSSAAFSAIGGAFTECLSCSAGGEGAFGTGLTDAAFGGKVFAHAIAGGVMSVLQGGKFGHGFAAAGVTQAFSGAIDGIGGDKFSDAHWDAGSVTARIVSAAVLGGTASVLSGGKFANGAVTGAFSRMFNDEGLTHQQYQAYRGMAAQYQAQQMQQQAETAQQVFTGNAVAESATYAGSTMASICTIDNASCTFSAAAGSSTFAIGEFNGIKVDGSYSADGWKFSPQVANVGGRSYSLTWDYSSSIPLSSDNDFLSSLFIKGSVTMPVYGILGFKGSVSFNSNSVDLKAGAGIVLGSSATAARPSAGGSF